MLIPVIILAGCTKEEWNLTEEETPQSTVIEGSIISSNGAPIAEVEIAVDYHENKWLQYSKTRHKAVTKTDKNGKYRLYFTVKDDEISTEQDKEVGIDKSYSMDFDLKNLDRQNYILPQDMLVTITSIEPPIGELTSGTQNKITYWASSFERSKTYTENLYIPQKRYVKVTLSGFIPQQQGGLYDHFGVSVAFPYGGENTTGYQFPGSRYGYGRIEDLFTLYDKDQQTFDVPCAINENNIIKLRRRKNSVYSTEEEHKIFVTKDSPQSLTYQY